VLPRWRRRGGRRRGGGRRFSSGSLRRVGPPALWRVLGRALGRALGRVLWRVGPQRLRLQRCGLQQLPQPGALDQQRRPHRSLHLQPVQRLRPPRRRPQRRRRRRLLPVASCIPLASSLASTLASSLASSLGLGHSSRRRGDLHAPSSPLHTPRLRSLRGHLLGPLLAVSVA
jgi:hypothetical protein